MDNSSTDFLFLLSGLNDTRTNKQTYFAFIFLLYLLTLFINLTLITIIFLDKMLHEPMYFFICNMCVNGIYGASGFYPKLLADLLSDFHVISYTGCMTQIFVIYSYMFCEFTNLTVMAYDRYVAICKPLEYHSIITPQRVGRLILLIWLSSLLETAVGTALTIRLPLCGYNIDKLYCSNWAVVKLACTDTTLNNLYGYILMLYHVSQAGFIVISYIYIIRASLTSKAGQAKFMQTCLPHLITLINFTVSTIFDVLYARYGNSHRLQALRNILAVEFLVVPPLLNPIIYGMKLTLIRSRLLKIFHHKVNAVN
ncbi:olfactory receptor 2G3-like [Chanos chanos]|uniref:Olfactory receptor 2G3-like n=1 Tax=Chanos chanos TaxID=29144 RepID=A0A6J2VLC9_CHACN|nr:olfactory receptor 2G3-like [Chanos chanos]